MGAGSCNPRGVSLSALALGQRCSHPTEAGTEPVAGIWLSSDSLSCSCPHTAGCSDCRNVLSKVTLSFGYFCYSQLSCLLGLRLWHCSHFRLLHPLSHLFVPNKIVLEEEKDGQAFKYRVYVLREECAERLASSFLSQVLWPKRMCVFVLPAC